MNIKTTRVVIAGLALAFTLSAQTAPPASSTAPPASRRTTARGTGSVTGVVKDDTGGIIPNAVVTLTDANGGTQVVNTGGDGSYVFRGVAPGTYTVSTTFKGLEQAGVVLISVTAGQPATGNVLMNPATEKQEITVTESVNNTVSTDPANNVGALVLKSEDLAALPDDPDDLQADLQALAGPSAGPGGNQIYIDGFTGGRLPPKESIREIRINSNPFSAEFDKLGFGRIQIFTKPGSDKFHGQAYYGISDDVWNARNPFLQTSPPFRSQLFGGNVSGPISKKGSFFIDVERRNIDDDGIIVASVLPSVVGIASSNPFSILNDYNAFQPTPQRRTTVSPRIDYQLNNNNTLSLRYSYLQNDRSLTGVGGFNLPSAGYSENSGENSVQVVETAVLGPHAVNETHFQYDHDVTNYNSVSATCMGATPTSANVASVCQPTINVSQSFVLNGNPFYGKSYDTDAGYEFQNYTSLTHGNHVTKFGIRIRATSLDDYSLQGFNGQFTFSGGQVSPIGADGLPILGAPLQQVSSIQQYSTLQQLQAANVPFSTIQAAGYGPSRYTINQGKPDVSLNQLDFGPFVQDDWRVKPNLTVSLGLRWEGQTNIGDKSDWAPRVAFAWSPSTKGKNGSKTVIRGGWGMFYDRFAILNVLNAYRFNGSNEQSYVVNDPSSYPARPSITQSNLGSNNSIDVIDSHLHSPYIMQTAIGVERQLTRRTTLSLNYTNSRGNHELRTVDINAPLVDAANLYPPASTSGGSGTVIGTRPNPALGNVYLYESSGIFRQNQLITSVNSQIGRSVTLFTRYVFGHANSDTDGLSTQPANPYNFAGEYSRSTSDVHHFLFLGGSLTAKYGIRLSPFIIMRTGAPYNITTGTDAYQTNAFTARPTIASSSTPGAILSPLGLYLNPVPTQGEAILERNAGNGPGFIGINLRLSKTWGFGTTKFSGTSGGARAGGGGPGGGGGRGGGGRGGGGFGGGPGGGGPGGMDGSTEHRFNLTLSANVRNILNHENLNTPNGSLTSPYRFQSLGISGGFGAEATSSEQRRMDLQLRFSF